MVIQTLERVHMQNQEYVTTVYEMAVLQEQEMMEQLPTQAPITNGVVTVFQTLERVLLVFR